MQNHACIAIRGSVRARMSKAKLSSGLSSIWHLCTYTKEHGPRDKIYAGEETNPEKHCMIAQSIALDQDESQRDV